MSSVESSGFPSQPFSGGLRVEPTAAEPPTPLQPIEEMQPVQPVPAPAPAPAPALEPLPPLQPLNVAPPAPVASSAPPAPVAPALPSPDEVANLGVPLGTLIFRAGLLTEEQLEDALQEGVRTGKRLGEVLLENGLLGEHDLGRLLADQKGLRFVELGSLSLDPAAVALLTAEKAHMFAALPIGFENGVPLVAVADPSNELVTENLRRALGHDPRLVVAARSDLHAAIHRLHGAAEAESYEEPAPFAAELAPVAPRPVAPEPAPVTVEPMPLGAEPTPEPVPVELEPVPAPPVLAPVVAEIVEERDPEPEPTFGQVEEEQPAPAEPAEPEAPSALSYDVSLRLSDGERVQIGSFGETEKAREYARDVVKHLCEDGEGWPFFSGRFIRPDTIVSVDIVPVGEPDRWLGSPVRANWASRLNR